MTHSIFRAPDAPTRQHIPLGLGETYSEAFLLRSGHPRRLSGRHSYRVLDHPCTHTTAPSQVRPIPDVVDQAVTLEIVGIGCGGEYCRSDRDKEGTQGVGPGIPAVEA